MVGSTLVGPVSDSVWDKGYSRAPTATLDSPWRPGLQPCQQETTLRDILKIHKEHKPHMQLFVLGYGEDKNKDLGPAPPFPRERSSTNASDRAAAARAQTKGTTRRTQRAQGAEDRDQGPASAEQESDGEGEANSAPDLVKEDPAPSAEHPDSFANAMLLAVRVGQAFSVLPADAVTGEWRPHRAAFAVAVSSGLTILTLLSFVQRLTLKRQTTLLDYMVVVFYLMTSVISWLFVRLARYWKSMLRAFRFQERKHGACPGLRRKLTVISVVLLSVAFVEHALSEAQGLLHLRQIFPNATTFGEYLQVYVEASYPMVVFLIGYWPILSPVLFFLNLTATFLWNFNDLFIMLIGVALATRFKILHESVSKAVGNTVQLKAAGLRQPVLGTRYWRSARHSYNSLSKLVKLVDEALNLQLMVSFLNNLYFVCMQLLRGFDTPGSTWYDAVYILFSFAFLVFRTSAVSLLAASVRDHSRAIKDVLFCVCSEDYDDEVYRLLVQVTSEEVALTGFNMFYVTRGLLLTVAGTILTYEVVLMQLH